jgi:DNA-binding transcriptional ArsR family regulator
VGVSFRSHLQVTFKYTNFKIMNVREMIPSAAEAADLMRSLSHPQRLLALCALGPDEKSVAELRDEIGGIEQVPMSQQLMRLRADGLVESRREGTSVYYRVDDQRVFELLAVGRAIITRQLAEQQSLLRELEAT